MNKVNSELDTQLERVEISIEDAKNSIALKKSLENLTNNPDFIKIVREGYFKTEAVRLVMLKADHNFRSDEDQKGIITALDGIGAFKMYCNTIMSLGRMAERALSDDEATREQILAEVV